MDPFKERLDRVERKVFWLTIGLVILGAFRIVDGYFGFQFLAK